MEDWYLDVHGASMDSCSPNAWTVSLSCCDFPFSHAVSSPPGLSPCMVGSVSLSALRSRPYPGLSYSCVCLSSSLFWWLTHEDRHIKLDEPITSLRALPTNLAPPIIPITFPYLSWCSVGSRLSRSFLT